MNGFASSITDSYEELKRRVPILDNYTIWDSRIRTADEIIPKDLIKKSPLLHINKVIGEDSREYISKNPISVRVYLEDDIYFAENENLSVCGTGGNQDEALQDLQLHIAHFYNYYNNIENDKLMGEALRLKKIYEGLF